MAKKLDVFTKDVAKMTEDLEKYTKETASVTEPQDYSEATAELERLELAAKNTRESFTNKPQV